MTDINMKLKQLLISKLLPAPLIARHSEYSMLFSADDDPSIPSSRLIDIAIAAAQNAQKISLNDVSGRIKNPPYYPDIWPGEHYRLLAGLTMALKPQLIVEIGTATGSSALSMKKYLQPGSKIVTFDVVEWKAFPDTCLNEDDFKDGTLTQHLDDLSDPTAMDKYRLILENVDMIFIDAAKDGVMEQKFLDNFKDVNFKNNPIIVFDDIRLWNMLKIWRNIRSPKLDLTSFGHWTGTGIMEWL